MNPLIAVVILALVQGLTEFLPISSSGHLVLTQALLGVESEGVALEIVLHVGTLLAVVLYYRNDLMELIREGLRFVGGRRDEASTKAMRMIGLLVLGTIPAAVAGVLLEDRIESAFQDPRFTCGGLLVTGALLLSTLRVPKGQREVNPFRAVVFGLFQMLALFPGISRSGSTITGGLLVGVKPEEAARFSFLLSVPIILGAVAFQLKDVSEGISSGGLLEYGIGLVVSFASGYLAIGTLLRIVRQGRFGWFGVYCLIVGALGLAYF